MIDQLNRRSMMMGMVPAGLASASIVHEVAGPGMDPEPKDSINFSVIGLDHYHIMSMTAAVIRGGGKLVSVYATSGHALADFHKRFGDVKVAKSKDEILNEPNIQLVAAAPIPDQRARLGIRVMQHGKDYLVDKPGIITLEELADVRKAIKDTKRIYAIMFSERLEVKAAVKAGELVKAAPSAASSKQSTWPLIRSISQAPPHAPIGSGIPPAMEASCATSVPIRPTSSCTTRVPPSPTSLPRKSPMSIIPTNPIFRISAT